MGFDAGSAVEALDYDFTAYVADARGTIPEPSQPKLERFADELREIATTGGITEIVKLGEDPSQEQLVAALADLPEDGIKQVMGAMTDAVVELCDGQPSREEIDALPGRVKQAFIGWVVGELMDPTQRNAGSRRSLAAANGARPST